LCLVGDGERQPEERIRREEKIRRGERWGGSG
jgi:hypothetical protein